MPKKNNLQIVITGRIQHVTYYNQDNHFMIARLKTDENRQTITIKGTMPSPKAGDSVEVRGTWQAHPRYGQQLAFTHFTTRLPATVEGVRNYLESGFIKGVGRKLVGRIVDHFKAETLSIIETAPDRLSEVNGIGKKTAQRILEAWQVHHAARKLIGFLEQNGVDPVHAARLLREYGNDAVEVLCNDPYRVAEDIPRFGFRIADAIVRNSDTPVDEIGRAKACLGHLLQQTEDQGHTHVAQTALLEKCQATFAVNPEVASEALSILAQAGELVVADEEPLVYPRDLYRAENAIARRILAMQSVPATDPPPEDRLILGAVMNRLSIALSDEQERILSQVFSHKVSVITGGPGTGKTTLVRSITAAMEATGRRVMLAAPTGRAARRLSEVTGKPSATLHKALGYNLADGQFERTEDDPLTADTVIVDEASMVDTLLMAHLIRAVPVTATLILVGDVFQLPSVGPGNVLADLIRSRTIATFELTEIFRQAERSPIVVNAHRVRKGLPPVIVAPDEAEPLSDFYFFEQANPEKAVETVVSICTQQIPGHFRLDPVHDIQVLTPMHRGLVGTLNLNRTLQAELNTATDQVDIAGGRFKVGDKVMHLKNNYRKEVFNGDIGIIAGIDKENTRIDVDYDGRPVPYDFLEVDELTLAYAISVHKSQGSEYPAVVIPLLTQHYIMLQRNLLYTALTRGRQLVVIVGTQKALTIALENDRPQQRRSTLARRLNPQLQLV